MVRHGETDSIAAKVYQRWDTPLSALGFQQADTLVGALAHLRPTIILSSPFVRAMQTAEPTAARLNVPVTTTDLLAECGKPSLLVGKAYADPEAIAVVSEMWERVADLEWHHSDEENFADLNKRAEQCLASMVSLQQETVLAFGHELFTKVLLGKVLLGDGYGPTDYASIYWHAGIRNTGISEFSYDPTAGWKLVSWNDHAHLA